MREHFVKLGQWRFVVFQEEVFGRAILASTETQHWRWDLLGKVPPSLPCEEKHRLMEEQGKLALEIQKCISALLVGIRLMSQQEFDDHRLEMGRIENEIAAASKALKSHVKEHGC